MSLITVGAPALQRKLKEPHGEFLGRAHESFGKVKHHSLTYLFHMCAELF